MDYQIFVPGKPTPYRERAYFQKVGKQGVGFIKSYLDRNCREWERQIKVVAGSVAMELLCGPIEATVEFRLLRPKSRPKKERYPDRRPDIENLAKAAIDGVNGILIRDDGQIVSLLASKRYCQGAEPPGVQISLKRILD